MKKVIIILLFILTNCSIFKQSQEISSINSFNQANFTNIKDDSLVIFDVDETLIQPIDSYLINEQTEQAKELRFRLVDKHKEVKDWNKLTSMMLSQAKYRVIEPAVISKIQQLQKHNIPVIAVTNMNTGKFGEFKTLEEWRYNHLKSFGFQGSFSDKNIKLNGFKRKPVFYHGILAADLEPKGLVLFDLLQQINVYPDEVIMFDDVLDYLKSVQQECKKHGIKFKGYHYQGAENKPWNGEIINYQAEYLIKNNKWLSDVEAETILLKKVINIWNK